jgi:hypothetical protein
VETCSDAIDINKEINVRLTVYELKEKSKETRKHNWFTEDSKIDVDDIHVYLTTNCPYLLDYAKKRIDGISKTEGGKKMILNFMEKAKQRIKREETEKKLEQERENEMMAQIANDRSWNYNYSKAAYDISDILDDVPTKATEYDIDFPMFK